MRIFLLDYDQYENLVSGINSELRAYLALGRSGYSHKISCISPIQQEFVYEFDQDIDPEKIEDGARIRLTSKEFPIGGQMIRNGGLVRYHFLANPFCHMGIEVDLASDKIAMDYSSTKVTYECEGQLINSAISRCELNFQYLAQ